MEPRNAFTRDVIDYGKVKIYDDDSRRVFFADKPLGRKLQAPGVRCSGEHQWSTDRYPGVRHAYVDKVCTLCHRRIPVV